MTQMKTIYTWVSKIHVPLWIWYIYVAFNHRHNFKKLNNLDWLSNSALSWTWKCNVMYFIEIIEMKVHAYLAEAVKQSLDNFNNFKSTGIKFSASNVASLMSIIFCFPIKFKSWIEFFLYNIFNSVLVHMSLWIYTMNGFTVW